MYKIGFVATKIISEFFASSLLSRIILILNSFDFSSTPSVSACVAINSSGFANPVLIVRWAFIYYGLIVIK